MQESSLEKRLRLAVKKSGGKAYKFTSPGRSGMPDRLILKPGGQALFVEMKAPGKPLKPLQEKRSLELAVLGFKYYKIDSLDDIQKFIREEFSRDL